MNSYDQCQSLPWRLDSSDLRDATRWVAATWLDRFGPRANKSTGNLELAEFGVLEPYLAEAVVRDRGADFVFTKWGAALSSLCGGDRRDHRMSVLPQPSRGQLRRICVRAVATQLPQANHATWAIDGQIWQCTMLALPTAGDELSATRLLVALLFAPHPIFARQFALWGKEARPDDVEAQAIRTVFPNP